MTQRVPSNVTKAAPATASAGGGSATSRPTQPTIPYHEKSGELILFSAGTAAARDHPEDPVAGLLSCSQQRRVLGTDRIGTEDTERDRADCQEHHGGDGDPADDPNRNGAPRVFDLARHDRRAHEPVPRPEEDRRTREQSERSLVADDR